MNQPILTISKSIEGVWEYELAEDYEVRLGDQRIVVPTGFSYDGATIPSVAWQALYTPFDSIVISPSLVHDWLYSNHQTTRPEADEVFRDLLLGNGVPGGKVRVVYAAVTLFGDEYWPNTETELEYLKQLYSRCQSRPNLDAYRFPLGEMGIGR